MRGIRRMKAHGEAAVVAVEGSRNRGLDEPMYGLIDRLAADDERTEVEAVADAVRDGLREHPTFRAVTVDVEGLKPSTRREGDTEGSWTAMDRDMGVLAGLVVIDWTDTDHLSGSVTVYVGSAGFI